MNHLIKKKGKYDFIIMEKLNEKNCVWNFIKIYSEHKLTCYRNELVYVHLSKRWKSGKL